MKTAPDPITSATLAIAESQPEILATFSKAELRERVEEFAAAMLAISRQRKSEIV